MDMNFTIVNMFKDLASQIHENSVDKGFATKGYKRHPAQLLALIHSEVSEALEAFREEAPVAAIEEELADIIIRTLDLAAEYELDVGSSILAKLEYNKKRAYKHGKAW